MAVPPLSIDQLAASWSGPIIPHTGGNTRGNVTELHFTFDDEPIAARAGMSLAAALLAAGVRVLGRNPVDGSPRGIFCAMGVCQECVVVVDGARVEACRTVVREGMVVQRTT
jgi:predicted molibdopterin-dependent oxidoreductase YjgC